MYTRVSKLFGAEKKPHLPEFVVLVLALDMGKPRVGHDGAVSPQHTGSEIDLLGLQEAGQGGATGA